MPVLEVENATVQFGAVRALDDVSLQLESGEVLAIVGESGCGKTTLARSVLGLQQLVGGIIQVAGVTVDGIKAHQAERIGMVWQDPYASLDPRWQIGRSIEEPARLCNRTIDVDAVMNQVGLDPNLKSRYPHQLSGGQRQRVAIGRALALRPPLVICDEPTAALDLSIQAQILNLLKTIQGETQCATLFISHDLVTVRFLADRVAVMYLGRIVEIGPTEEVFERPRHRYTKALLDSAPTLDKLGYLPDRGLEDFGGVVIGEGCRFAPRCRFAQDDCRSGEPPEFNENGHRHRCLHPNRVDLTDLTGRAAD